MSESLIDKYRRISYLNKNVANNSISIPSKELQKIQQREEAVIDFLKQKHVPSWFRGTSTFQINATKSLLNALRDDSEQNTVHRVRACLLALGLKPLIRSKDMKYLMDLSQRNDIAFLWFVMELHYKSPPGSKGYNLNEQLILSAIAQLDMIPTIQELDRLLPPGIKKRKTLTPERPLKYSYFLKKPEKTDNPYFQRQIRPVKNGKPLFISRPDFRVRLDYNTYGEFFDPHYKAANLETCWYPAYKINPAKRIVSRIIVDTLYNVFNNYESVRSKMEKHVSLCETHKDVNNIEKHIKTIEAKERCMKHLILTTLKEKNAREEVIARLKRDVDRVRCKWYFMLKMKREQVVLRVASQCQCQCFIARGEDEPMECALKPSWKPKSARTIKNIKKCTICDQCAFRPRPTNYFKNAEQNDKFAQIYKNERKRNMLGTCGNNDEIANDANSGTKSSEMKYFKITTEHQPYVFDYPKIFHYDDETVQDLKLAFVDILDSELALTCRKKNIPLDLKQAAWNNITKLWNSLVELKTAEMVKEEKEKLKRGVPEVPKFYDCNDDKLMSQMLEDALKIMAKNPKFILAGIPDAHKLPFLTEWIKQRYGKVYTPEECFDSFRMTRKIIAALSKLNTSLPLPHSKDIGTNLYIDYSCRNYLIKKANEFKNQFNSKIDNIVMDKARMFWYAMNPYLCSNGPPRNTFFAYMPPRVQNITRFRLWRPTEYMDAKKEWGKRQMAKGNKIN